MGKALLRKVGARKPIRRIEKEELRDVSIHKNIALRTAGPAFYIAMLFLNISQCWAHPPTETEFPDLSEAEIEEEIGGGELDSFWKVSGGRLRAGPIELVLKVPRVLQITEAIQEQALGVKAGIYPWARLVRVGDKQGFLNLFREDDETSLSLVRASLVRAAKKGWIVLDVRSSNIIGGQIIAAIFEKAPTKSLALERNKQQFEAYCLAVRKVMRFDPSCAERMPISDEESGL
jgi:hypothetical protein